MTSSDPFPALPGFYRYLFCYIEPISALAAIPMIYFGPGPAWFYSELIPTGSPSPDAVHTFPDANSRMAILLLVNCYILLGLLSAFIFPAIRKATKNNLEGQEMLVAAVLTPLTISDINHSISTFVGLPPDIRFAFWKWNMMTHGNITFTLAVLFTGRIAWFLGIGRTRLTQVKVKSS
ncbi:hypothetical protein DL96DRAFT_1571389 [Flagelloscypha sp. PMI_526]|nr:hypothetical protein DL96DRAFT_1571389 [Flagelloscypha sp. PMI_526]